MDRTPVPRGRPRSRIVLVALLGVVIVLGLASRRFGAHLPAFLAVHAGDALWTVAVYLALAVVLPAWPALRLGIAALAISFAVEASQLIQLDWLDPIRRSLPGRLLLGSGFLWLDLIRYAAGAGLATITDLVYSKRHRG